MSLYVEEREDGSFAFYMEGDLQFDSRDEAIYHESLVLPALSLSEAAEPEGKHILICGGGDGLALRECLRFPHVAKVDLVDIDDSVVQFGKTRFASLNRNAFADPRAKVSIADAWDFLEEPTLYDAIICDFTVPRRPEETRIFSLEWYERLRSALTPRGILAMNAVSPERTPEAFWCLKKTVRRAGLYPVTYRVCIPSFREQGYGAWGFMVASPRPLGQAHLRSLSCPVETYQTDLTKLWRGTKFERSERLLEGRVGVNSLAHPCLLPLILNPNLAQNSSARSLAQSEEPFSLYPLIRALPIQHPYHTREMVESVAEHVMGSIRTLDIPRLVEALLARAAQLPRDLVKELERLQEFLRLQRTLWESFGRWCYRLFAVLVVIMTLANMIMPDAAFGKGSFGIGRSSMSRGYSTNYHASGSSFGGQRGFSGSSGGGRGALGGSFGAPRARISSTGFRRSYGNGGATDIYGNSYRAREFRYYDEPGVYINFNTYGGGGGMRGNGSSAPRQNQTPKQQKALFVADEDMMVLENGDVVITLSEDAYLLLRQGHVFLMSQKEPAPLLELFADTEIFQSASGALTEQQQAAEEEKQIREQWLSWVSWSSVLFPNIAADKQEVQNISDMEGRIQLALKGIGTPKPAAPVTLPPGAIELFAGCYLLTDQSITCRRADGSWLATRDGHTWAQEVVNGKPNLCPPALQPLLQGIIVKLIKEFTADFNENLNDLKELAQEKSGLQKDLLEYQNLSGMFGTNYEVDYGTDSLPAYQAVDRTQGDIGANENAVAQTIKEQEKLIRETQALKDFRF